MPVHKMIQACIYSSVYIIMPVTTAKKIICSWYTYSTPGSNNQSFAQGFNNFVAAAGPQVPGL
jgi:hypothetical protein